MIKSGTKMATTLHRRDLIIMMFMIMITIIIISNQLLSKGLVVKYGKQITMIFTQYLIINVYY